MRILDDRLDSRSSALVTLCCDAAVRPVEASVIWDAGTIEFDTGSLAVEACVFLLVQLFADPGELGLRIHQELREGSHGFSVRPAIGHQGAVNWGVLPAQEILPPVQLEVVWHDFGQLELRGQLPHILQSRLQNQYRAHENPLKHHKRQPDVTPGVADS